MKKIHAGVMVGAVIFLVGCGNNNQVESAQKNSADSQAQVMQEKSENTKGTTMHNGDVDVFEGVEPVSLGDVSGGTASGLAWTVFKDGKTHHRVVAKDMPKLTNGDFYEGWLVKRPVPGGFFTTGEMNNEGDGDFTLDYTQEGNVTDHPKVVITLEPDDGDPAPAAHIIEN